MKRNFIRRRDSLPQETGEKLNIGVIGLGRSVGTTFVSSSLAFYFAEKGKSVTFTQCQDPTTAGSLLYDAVAMDKRFSGREFTDFYKLIRSGDRIKNLANKERDVSWVLITPEDCSDGIFLNPQQRSRLVMCAASQVAIFDIDGTGQWTELLRDMDLIIAVTDPLPSKMIRNAGLFSQIKKLELEGTETIWVVNKVNKGVNRRQVAGYLKTRNAVWIEHFDPAIMYTDEYFCRFPWEDGVIKRRLLEIFTKLSH